MDPSIVILAAGQGTRMRSARPKVLHTMAGRPLLEHVVATARELSSRPPYVVYGHGGGQVPAALAHLDARWIEQSEQLGTGHAVQQVLPRLDDGQTVLVLYGDVPLIRAETLRRLLDGADPGGLGVLTAQVDDPAGYGRVERGPGGAILRIVEHKDATEAQRRIGEINTGILVAGAANLRRWLAELDNDNAQGEYYLTDVIAMAAAEGLPITSAQPEAAVEILGVNDKLQLSIVERAYQRRQAEALMRAGVTLMDPDRIDLRGTLSAGRDVTIDINVVIEGEVSLGDGTYVGPNTVLTNVQVGSGVQILPNCVIEDAAIGDRCRVGPFTRIRPQTRLGREVHLGNFVELKKSSVEDGSKINHLTYVGDTAVGRKVNIGAGTIVCNYDGANKHQTVIEDEAFIGSDTQLVAPVRIGKGATIGAGSTITRDAPAGKLTLARGRQTTVEGWQRPKKKE